MPIKSDLWIIQQCENSEMIRPFAKEQVKQVDLPGGNIRRVVSYGVSSYGYDMRLGNIFKVCKQEPTKEIDPKNINPGLYKKVRADDYIVLPPQGLILGQTLEYFKIPRNILTICFGKSTYARCGVFINITPFEPEWEGYATLAISNLGPHSVRIYSGEGVAQLLFLQSDEVCFTSYRDKEGKYQAQKEITVAKV